MNKTDPGILAALKIRKHKIYKELYDKNYSFVERYVLKNSGTVEDAEDIFQDCLIILFKKAQSEDFQLTASIDTYLYAVSKNLWLNKLRNKSSLPVIKIDDNINICSNEDFITDKENERTYVDKIAKFMARISAHCYHLLHAMIFNNKGIQEIQKIFGYTTRHNAQNQKYKCMEQAKKAVEQPETKIEK